MGIRNQGLNSSINSSIAEAQDYKIPEKIKHLLAFTFGKKGEKPYHWIDDVPLIRRSSPSGGSRHTTEGYFLSIDLAGIQQGLYYIKTDPISLSLISEDKSSFLNDLVERDSPVLGRIRGLTSVFERNMYRYREPRTFRTIRMDIGHILATIEMLAQEFGIKTRIHLNFIAVHEASRFLSGCDESQVLNGMIQLDMFAFSNSRHLPLKSSSDCCFCNPCKTNHFKVTS